MRVATSADTAAIQALLELDPATWQLLEGAPLRPDEGHLLFDDRPPGVALDRKHTLLVDDDGASGGARRCVAVIDLLERYPDDHTWFLGLILIAPAARGRGLGTRLLDELSAYVRSRGGRRLRLAVAVDNTAARRLYDRLGFAVIARRSRTSWNGTVAELDVLEREL